MIPSELESSSAMTASTSASGDGTASSVRPSAAKKKRNLPGMPDPEAEVLALSPTTLMATNRFVCEVCSKGFQRDQNLQLHRRGHNLPWKLRQRSGKEPPRKRVYVCPEPSCVHHDPSRALGDLTGIKKHYSRKHGEKKWKCDRCSKKYAVQADWKAHSKTCGSREYRCDCGTLFSRRDTFITHRAFCDVLTEEKTKAVAVTAVVSTTTEDDGAAQSPPIPTPPPAAAAESSIPAPELQGAEPAETLQHLPPASIAVSSSTSTSTNTCTSSSSSASRSIFGSLFCSAGPTPAAQGSSFSDFIGAMSRPNGTAAAAEPISLCLGGPGSLFSLTAPPPQSSPHMSATALLQKAAQMGAAASSSSFLKGFGLATSSSSSPDLQWSRQPLELEPPSLTAGLGLGLPYQSSVAPPELMMGPSSLFGPKPSTTLDFLGLGMGPGGSGTGGLSALISSIGGGSAAQVGPFGSGGSSGPTWEAQGRKPRSPAIL